MKFAKSVVHAGLVLAGIASVGLVSASAKAEDKVDPKQKAQIVFPGSQWKTATPESQGIKSANLEKAIETLKSFCGKDGVDEVVIIRNGYVLWSGPKVDNQRLIWSCTKSFMSVCLGLLWDDGLVKPSDLAMTHNPLLKEFYPTATIEHFATFTSGYASGKTALEPEKPKYEPGAAFEYSSQSDMLSATLSMVAKRSLESLFFERIGKPIGITREDMDWGEVTEIKGLVVNGGAGLPGSGVRINALALARFGWLMCNDGVWDGKRLLSHEYISYATQPRTSVKTPPLDPKGWYVELPGNYGLNWWTNGPKPQGGRVWSTAPASMFAAQGNKNNNCFIIPDWNLVVVRMGADAIVSMSAYDPVFELLDPNKQGE